MTLNYLRREIFPAVLFLLILLATPCTANTLTPVDGVRPIPIYISVLVIDVDGVDSAEQNFTANVFYQFRWHDPRLAHAGKQSISRSLNEVWNPMPQIVNQQRLWRTFPELVTIEPDGGVTYRQRVWGTFSQPLRLRDFPFDKQAFTIQFATAGYRHGDLVLISTPDFPSGIASELSLADWGVVKTEYGEKDYQPMKDGFSIPGFHFTFYAERYTGYYILKIILPLLMIVAMSWIVFWVDPREAGTQISVAITTMLTLIAYRFAVGADLPKVSYMTRMDFFILISTVLVFATLMEVVVTSTLAKKNKLNRAQKIDQWARWLVPSGFIAVTLFSFLG